MVSAASYDIMLNFITTMNGKKDQDIIPKSASNKLKKSVSSIEEQMVQVGNLRIKKGSILDAETIKKATADMSGFSEPIKDFQMLGDIGLKFGGKEMGVFEQNTTKATVSLKEMQGTFSQLMQVERLRTMGVDTEFLNEKLTSIRIESKASAKNFNAMQKQAKQMSKAFDMSALSLLFFSQAVNRLIGGVFNQMLNTFKTVDKKGITPLNRALTKLEASFAFLSFTLMRALEPILIPIIDIIVSAVDWFSELPTPILTLIGVVGLLAIALTGLATWFFTIKLAAGALGVSMNTLGLIIPGVTKLLSSAAGSSTLATSLGMGGLAGAAILAVGAIVALLLWMYIFDQASKSSQVYSQELGASFNNMGMDVTEAFNDMSFGIMDFGGIFQALGTIVGNVMTNFDMYVQAGFAAIASTVMLIISNMANGVSFTTGLIKTIVGAAVDGIIAVINTLITAWNKVQKLRGNKGDTPLLQQTSIAGEGLAQMAKSVLDVQQTAELYVKTLGDIGRKENEILALGEAAKINKENMRIFNEGRIPTAVSPPQLGITKEEIAKQSAEINALVAVAAKQATDSYKDNLALAAPEIDAVMKNTVVPAVTDNIDVNNASSGSLIANTPLYAEDFIITYSDKMREASPYLDKTMFDVFSKAGTIMYDTTHVYVQKTIADIQRAINKMKELQAISGNSRSTTNNTTNANKITINSASGTDITKAITKANIAVPVGRQ